MRLLIFLSMFFVMASPIFATTYHVKQGSNEVTWTAVGNPGFLRINGEGGKVKGHLPEKDGKVFGVLEVDLSKYKTGMSLRDEHMHETYLEIDKYQTAKLILDPFAIKEGESKFSGILHIKEDKAKVSGKATVKKSSKHGYHVVAEFSVNLKDYPSIGVPSYLGITVAESIDVKVDFLVEGVQDQ